MDTSTTTFCKFSPLRTPHIKLKQDKKYNSPRKEISDTDSIVSMVTRDVRKIAKSVSDKLKNSSEDGLMSSDDDLFISQSKKVVKPGKGKNNKMKRQVSDSHSNSTKSDDEVSAESEIESPKKHRKLQSQENIRQKKTQIKSPKNSPVKSSVKSPVKSSKRLQSNMTSDSDSNSASLPAHDSPRRKKSNKNSDSDSYNNYLTAPDSPVISPVKSQKKRQAVSDSDSDSTKLVSERSTVTKSDNEEVSTDSEIVSPKKRRKLDTFEVTQKKKKTQIKSPIKTPVKSPVKSPGKTNTKRKNHMMSDSDSDNVSLPAPNSPRERKSSGSSVLTSSSDSSDGGRKNTGNIASSNSLKKKVKRKESSSAVSDSSGSESESDDRSRGKTVEHQNLKNVQQNVMSEDSDFDTRPTKNVKKRKAVDNEMSTTNENSGKLRYKVPEGFEIDASQKYVSKADLQGKQLWLITTPDDFDISSLHKQKIKITGSSIVTSDTVESEKQFEVVARPLTSQMSSYNSVAIETSGREEFAIGSEIRGQIQVMDWIPAMPPVELVRPPPTKHRVPDNLKPTFTPFGSDSPTRQNEDESIHVQKTEKHKKKKKKKDKKKEK